MHAWIDEWLDGRAAQWGGQVAAAAPAADKLVRCRSEALQGVAAAVFERAAP
jgi:hypothetical protein